MTLQSIVEDLILDAVGSLDLFRPELALCGTIVVLLLAKIPRSTSWISPFLLALVGSVIALWSGLPSIDFAEIAAGGGLVEKPVEIFDGMLVYDSLTVFIRGLLLVFVVLFLILTRVTKLADRENGQDFYVLVLGATLGMCIMASSNHLITVFLGVEMASVPSYVLAGIVRGRRRASEAALKYAVYGAGAAGVMLYGISLLAGVIGSAHLPTMAKQLAAMDLAGMIASGEQTGTIMVLALGGLMVMVGLAFKLSAVPFHFWCPDVFEGASAEVNAFLSVASKAAALALLVRVAMGLGVVNDRDSVAEGPATAEQETDQVVHREASEQGPFALASLAEEEEKRSADAEKDEVAWAQLAPVRKFMTYLIALIAIVTCTFGNLAAYGQTNIKRMLAYSTIAHAGYMMMPVAAASAMGFRGEGAERAIAALLFYASVYLFMNLGAFAIVAFLRNSMHSEEIADYGGLIRTAPVTTIAMVIIMFSLVGLPPLAGFVGKLFIFYSLIEAGGPLLMFVLVVAGVNTVLSLVYYLRVVRVMCIEPEPDSRPPVTLDLLSTFYAALITAPVLLFGIFFDPIPRSLALAASRHLFG